MSRFHIQDIGEVQRIAAHKAKDFAALQLQAWRLIPNVLTTLRRDRKIPSDLLRDWLDDMQGAAGAAIPELVKRWDPAKGKFDTFVWHRLAGAMLDELKRLRAGSIGGDDETDDSIDAKPCSDGPAPWPLQVLEDEFAWNRSAEFLATKIVPVDQVLPSGRRVGAVWVRTQRKKVCAALEADMKLRRCTAGEAALRLYGLLPPPMVKPDPAQQPIARATIPRERETAQHARTMLSVDREDGPRGSISYGGFDTLTGLVYHWIGLVRRAMSGAPEARRNPNANPDELPPELSPEAKHGAVRHLNKLQRQQLVEFVSFMRRGGLHRWIDEQPKTPADQIEPDAR